MSVITYEDICEIFGLTVEGIFQQNIDAEARAIFAKFPRNPIDICRGLEAVYGIRIYIKPRDFYKDIEDIPVERRDLFAFHENTEHGDVIIYVNKNIAEPGVFLLSEETRRFVVLKEAFTAVIRKHFHDTGRSYPDSISFGQVVGANLDWLSERPSIYDIGGEDDSPAVSIENAAEILALLFLVDIKEVHEIRENLLRENGQNEQSGSNGPDLKFSLFEYEKIAKKYKVNVRFLVVLVRTKFISKFWIDLKKRFKKAFEMLFGDGDE